MSSIKPPGTRGAHTPGAVDDGQYKSLTDVANALGINGPDAGAGDKEGTGKAGKGGKGKHAHLAGIGAGADAGAGHRGKVGAGTDTLTASTASSQGLTSTGSSPSVLPDPNLDDGASMGSLAVGDVTGSAAAATSLSAAQDKLSADFAKNGTSQATLAQDVKDLKSALTAAGVTTPVGQVVHDLVDPTGAGVKPTAALSTAAKTAGVDITQGDSTDVATAQTTLTQLTQATPANTAAINVATDHLVRASGLAGTPPADALAKVVTDSGSNASGLAALYAQAAKNGVDLSDQGGDKVSAAQNKSAQNKMERQRQTAAQQANESQNTNTGATGTGGMSAYGTGEPSNTTQYASIAKTGAGSSAGGWDTSGNEPIAPNKDNPVDFAKDYGLKGGFTSESMDDLLAKVPQLTSQYPNIKQTLTDAANSVNPPIPPQLLLSTLGVETSYACNFGTNAKDGPFQFIASTFAAYGSGDRTNMGDAAKAAANYYHTLLQQNGNDLYAAMRDYNGDVTQGASNSYQKDQQSIFNGNVGG